MTALSASCHIRATTPQNRTELHGPKRGRAVALSSGHHTEKWAKTACCQGCQKCPKLGSIPSGVNIKARNCLELVAGPRGRPLPYWVSAHARAPWRKGKHGNKGCFDFLFSKGSPSSHHSHCLAPCRTCQHRSSSCRHRCGPDTPHWAPSICMSFGHSCFS